MIKEATPKLVLEIQTAFEEIARSLTTAAEQRSFRIAATVAEHFGLEKQKKIQILTQIMFGGGWKVPSRYGFDGVGMISPVHFRSGRI